MFHRRSCRRLTIPRLLPVLYHRRFPHERNHKPCIQTLRAQVPALYFFFSGLIPLYITYTRWEYIIFTVIVYADFTLALSSTAWITSQRRRGRSSRRGGPSHRRDVAVGLCGHPASQPALTFKHVHANRKSPSARDSVTCHPLFSQTVITICILSASYCRTIYTAQTVVGQEGNIYSNLWLDRIQ